MVKAYLRYVQDRNISGLVGNLSNLKIVKVRQSGSKTEYLVTASNEVVNLSNIRTGEVEYQIFDREAMHGQVSCIGVSGALLAIGYSDGTILVFDLDEQLTDGATVNVNTESRFEQVSQFSFHKSAVTSIIFTQDNTQLVSGGADSYIIIYDLVTSTAEYKLLGHAESITQLQSLVTQHPVRGTPQRNLISSSKDGLLKVWDLQNQTCVGTFGEQTMQKVNDFCLIGELGLLITASVDKQLRIFKVEVIGEAEASMKSEIGQVTLKSLSSINRESGNRALQVSYEKKRNLLMVLSSDNLIEVFKVNVDKPESIYKKLKRAEKKKALKRTHAELEGAEPAVKKVDKEKLQQMVDAKDYNMALHFSHRLTITLDPQAKAKAFVTLQSSSKSKKDAMQVLVAYHSNTVIQHEVDFKAAKEKKGDKYETSKANTFGELTGHKQPVRGVAMAANDSLFATNSFDSVKVWQVDLQQYSKTNKIDVQCKSSIEEQNVLSMAILPGQKLVVLGTKEGQLMLYDLAQNAVVQRIKAHHKEVWEISYHTNPQSAQVKGSLLIASASADKTIKFYTLASTSQGDVKLQFYEKVETTDEVMGVKFTTDGQFFVFSLLDSTLKVCYVDSMKLLLNLYGHKLPVLSFDISSDGQLLATGSADKNLKIWGMQFGDIHKSMFLHTDSITCVRFIRDTHYALTASKDREVKMVDCDTYDEVFVFDQFFSEVWGLAVSSIGDYFVVASGDRNIRIWRQTTEQAFVTDEQDYRQEKLMLKEAEKEYTEIDLAQAAQVDPFAKDKVVKIETGQAVKRTAESIRYGDELMSGIELCDEFRAEVEQYQMALEKYEKRQGAKPEKPTPSIHFLGKTVYDLVLERLKQIRSSDLESTLRFLNYRQCISLLFYLEHYLRNNIETELATRVTLYILGTYETQIVQQVEDTRKLLYSIAIHLKHLFKEQRIFQLTVGVNMAALSILKKEISSRSML